MKFTSAGFRSLSILSFINIILLSKYTTTHAEETTTDIAYARPVKCSSVHPTSGGDYACENAVDHDFSTPWQGHSGSGDASWMNVDLGETGMTASISKVEIQLGLCHNFQLTTSTAVGCLNDNGFELPDNKVDFANANCASPPQCEYAYSVSNVRCIKFYCNNKANNHWLPSMSDFRVFVLEDVAGGGGDPHFIGFGGNFFTWQGHCDLVLIKTPKLSNEDDNLEVHIRTTRIRKWSKIGALAIQVGKDKGEIESNEGKLMLNGSQVESFKTESMSVVKYITKLSKNIVLYKFMFSQGKVLEVKINIRLKIIYVSLSGRFPEGTVGILGSPTKPGLFARNGENMEGKNMNVFAETWQVNDDDAKLFHERRHPQFPSKCLYRVQHTPPHVHSVTRRLKKVHELNMEEATVACDIHLEGPLKQFCIEDVCGSGDLDFAKDDFYG